MTLKSRPPIKAPFVLKHENVSLKIYSGVNRVKGISYPEFTLVYQAAGQRKKKKFADFAKAKKAGKLIAHSLSRGEIQMLQLNSADRSIYLQSVKLLEPFQIPLNVAVQEYTAALKKLPNGTSLKEAVDLLLRHDPGAREKRTARQVADELLAAKRGANLSAIYLKDLDIRLNRFCSAFQMNIGDISGRLLQTWLDEMKGSGRTKQNYLRVVASLFRFAVRRRYLSKDALEEIEAVQQTKEDHGEIEIFTPDEMIEILTAGRSEMVPWLAIAGFAGLRTAEIQRLDWSEINLSERHIEIKASKSKTAARRLAPVTDNLASWLTLHAKSTGKVVEFERWWNEIPKVVEAVNEKRKMSGRFTAKSKFVWKHNALRHSFCSYRLAAIKNTAQVALEAGNSAQMIFKHYRQLVTESEAAKWFSIQPPKII